MVRRATTIWLVLLGCALAAVASGCGDPAALQEQRERLEADQRARLQHLEELEIRLVSVGARQRAWTELQARHAQVSAVACANMAEHVSAMQAHDARQREKVRTQRSRRRAAAQARLEQAPVHTAAVESEAGNN